MEERDVIADLRGLTDGRTHVMVNEETLTDPRGRMGLDIGEAAGRLRQNVHCESVSPVPQLVSRPMRPQGVNTRVGEGHLHAGAGGGITFASRGQAPTGQVQEEPLGVVYGAFL